MGELPSVSRQQILCRKAIGVEPDLEFEAFLREDYIENFKHDPYEGLDSDQDYIADINLAKEQ